jgi:AcrR family transcriptional regulator
MTTLDTVKPAKTTKGEQTRANILGTALKLFRERGYDGTTMRAIAADAGVSLGNAYYYFASKEHLIQAFYARTHEEHLEACAEVLGREKNLRARLMGVMSAKLDTIEPYHRFAGVLFKTAADPNSPLNPFSEASREVREEATALFARVVEGSDARVPERLAAELPDLLWTYHMGIILFWIYDDSPGRGRSRRLTEQTVGLVVKMISMSRLPLMRPLISKALRLTAELRAVPRG